MYAYAAEAQPARPTHGGTAYIQPSTKSFMINYNRDNLEALVEDLMWEPAD
jgi:hypothetical protein